MFVAENQDGDVVEDLKGEGAYSVDEEFSKEVDEYFCREMYKNQQFFKTHAYTFYDAMRYTEELRADEQDCQ